MHKKLSLVDHHLVFCVNITAGFSKVGNDVAVAVKSSHVNSGAPVIVRELHELLQQYDAGMRIE